MSKTVETLVVEEQYEHPEGRWADSKVTYEVTIEPGEFYPVVVSVKLIEIVEDGIVDDDIPLYRRRAYENGKAEAIALERGIIAKHFDIDPADID